MEPYQERVVTEHTELLLKERALHAFIQTPNFRALGDEDQRLLLDQHAHMRGYVHILDRRIKRFGA